MNNDYESVVKEIDEMLLKRQIDKLLNTKKSNINKKHKKKTEHKKTKDFTYKLYIHELNKEEIIKLPKKSRKEIVDLYE
jgi:hypothetical protein